MIFLMLISKFRPSHQLVYQHDGKVWPPGFGWQLIFSQHELSTVVSCGSILALPSIFDCPKQSKL